MVNVLNTCCKLEGTQSSLYAKSMERIIAEMTEWSLRKSQ